MEEEGPCPNSSIVGIDTTNLRKLFGPLPEKLQIWKRNIGNVNLIKYFGAMAASSLDFKFVSEKRNGVIWICPFG